MKAVLNYLIIFIFRALSPRTGNGWPFILTILNIRRFIMQVTEIGSKSERDLENAGIEVIQLCEAGTPPER